MYVPLETLWLILARADITLVKGCTLVLIILQCTYIEFSFRYQQQKNMLERKALFFILY